jgi:hypothetical protein
MAKRPSMGAIAGARAGVKANAKRCSGCRKPLRAAPRKVRQGEDPPPVSKNVGSV